MVGTAAREFTSDSLVCTAQNAWNAAKFGLGRHAAWRIVGGSRRIKDVGSKFSTHWMIASLAWLILEERNSRGTVHDSVLDVPEPYSSAQSENDWADCQLS